MKGINVIKRRKFSDINIKYKGWSAMAFPFLMHAVIIVTAIIIIELIV